MAELIRTETPDELGWSAPNLVSLRETSVGVALKNVHPRPTLRPVELVPATKAARVIVLTPASPGSKGDEGMMLGAMSILDSHPVVILNPGRGPKWLEPLSHLLNQGRSQTWSEVIAAALPGKSDSQDISEVEGAFANFIPKLKPTDSIFCVGADVLDGTCGVGLSLRRLNFMLRAQHMGLRVTAVCSFRENVDRRILAKLRQLSSSEIYLRDHRSFTNFHAQVGRKGNYFPDLSTVFDIPEPMIADSRSKIRTETQNLRSAHSHVFGLNFAEQSFRSFKNFHTPAARRDFVARVVKTAFDHIPNGHCILISNDNRNWLNLPSDAKYIKWAKQYIEEHYGPSRCTVWKPSLNYANNIALMETLDLVITGRMHLAHAAVRSNTLPLILMGKGKAYSSFNKMAGMYESFFGTSEGVVTKLEELPTAIDWLLKSRPEHLANLRQRNADLRHEREFLMPGFRQALGLD